MQPRLQATRLKKPQTERTPPKTFDHPIKPPLAELARKYFGIARIPADELEQLGRMHNCSLLRDGNRMAITPVPKPTMQAFYLKHGFETKLICGKTVFVPPKGRWTDNLKREAIRYCVEFVLVKLPKDCNKDDFRAQIPGILGSFKGKGEMLQFAGYAPA